MIVFDTADITAAMERFSQAADIAKSHAGEVLRMISSGIVPSPHKMVEFDHDVAELQRHYDFILEAARACLSEDEMPEEATAAALLDAVEQKRKKVVEEKILSSSVVLQRFISVRSYLEAYAQALAPYQQKAAALLGDIGRWSLEAAEDSPVLESSLLFMKALDTENLESEEGLSTLEALGQFFPTKVQLGIARKQYYLAAAATEQPENPKEEREKPDVPSDPMESVQSLPASGMSSPFPGEAAAQGPVETAEPAEEESKAPDIAVAEEINVPADAAKEESNAPSEAAKEEGSLPSAPLKEASEIILFSINKVKKAAPSASAFKKEVPKLPKEAFALLPLLTNLGALSELQIFKFGVAMGCFVDDDVAFSSVKNSLNVLCNKSLLASFDLDGECVYCLTSYCHGCLRKETIQQSRLFQISFGRYSVVSDESILRTRLRTIIDYNGLLLDYFYGIKDHTSKENYQKIKSSLVMKNGFYRIAVPYNGTLFPCTLHNGTTNLPETENLLVVGEQLNPEAANGFVNVFTYAEGVVAASPAEGLPDGRNAAENAGFTEVEAVNPVPEEAKETPNEAAKEETVKADIGRPEALKQAHQRLQAEDIPAEPKEEPADPAVPELSVTDLIEKKTIPDDRTFCALIQRVASGKLFSSGVLSDVMRATLLAKAASLGRGNPECGRLAQKLLLSTHLPIGTYQYTSAAVSDALSDCDDEHLKIAIYMQALLTPASSYDYTLYQMAEESFRKYDSEFPSLVSIKPLFNKLRSLHDVIPMGFTPTVIGLLGDATARRQYAEGLQKKAKNLLILPNVNTRINKLTTLYSKCFGIGSELYDCIKSIAENKVSEYGWIRDVLTQYCDSNGTELVLSDEKIGSILDATWLEVNPKNPFVLEYGARDKLLREFDARLQLMRSWVEHIDQSDDGKLDVSRINVLKNEIVSLASAAAQKMSTATDGFSCILRYTLWFIHSYLTGSDSTGAAFREFLYTGVFSVDENWIPHFDPSTINIKYYEPWRRVLRHIASSIRSGEQARSAIVDEVGSELFDNLHQLSLLNQAEPEKQIPISENQIKDAKKAAEDRTKKFKENLELAFAYNRISEPEKEKLAAIMEEHKPKFFETMDFGCWSQFLDALEKTINELAAEKKKLLRKELDARKKTLGDGETSAILDEAEMLLEEKMYFGVAEEYLNRFDNGEREFSEDLYALLHEEDSYARFLSDEVFRPLQQECENHSGRMLRSFAWNYLEARVPRNWSNRQKESSQRLVESWPTKKASTTANMIVALFKELGFTVKRAERGSGKKEEFFKLDIEPTARSMADYRHPISLFGTQMKSPLNVVVLYGNYAPKQLVDTITGLDFGGMTVVLIDRPIDRAARRQVGEIFHTQTSGQNPFILVDQILILHLATYQVTERLPVMLKCTLPYTTYQPFVRDGGSTTDEMFCGRTKELNTIIDPNGACVVYGGRQLGKTALLQRAESRCSNPANKSYAVYCNIIDCSSEEALARKISEDVKRKTNLEISKTTSINDLCKQIDQLFRTGKVRTLLLLLDEADRFLAAIADKRYQQLQPLIDLKRETTNRFKFVLAGLHNVCRAKNATSDNGVFGQLGAPLCVKPLSSTDALQLLSRPLRYLGFEIDRYPHLETILTNTNYYPGILQFFGYNLVEALSTQYGRYYRAVDGNPPFTLQDDQLGAVMNDADLNRSIRDKFRWSLELDPRYFMLARCITILYYLRDEDAENWLGFSMEEIMGIAEEYAIRCLADCDDTDYINLLEEMVEMGILSKPDPELYRLRRNSFVNIIGSDFDSLNADIVKNNGEV